jgi:HK97 family phage major capsid protein
MDTMNLAKFRDVLTKAAALKGEAGVIAQKKLILDRYMIVDADGVAVDPEAIDITIAPAAAETEMQTDTAKEPEMNEDQIVKSVRAAVAGAIKDTAPKFAVTAEPKAWENARQYGRLKHLKSKESAHAWGRWVLASMGHKKSAEFCANNGLIIQKAHTEGVNSQGGFLVPDVLENELVSLREQYGVFRRNARVWPMTSDTLRIPKRAAGLTAYFVGEAAAGTESTQTFDSVTLVAKKLMALTTVTNELLEDAVINIGDDVAGEIAYAFAFKEDDAGFNGDGTSTYGGIVGLANTLTNATFQVSDGAQTATSGVTLAEISAAIAKLPGWAAQRNNIKFYCNKSVYHSVFERLMFVTGSTPTGASAAEIASGGTGRFLGYPVEFSQALTAAPSGAGAVFAYVGDLAQGCYFGDRRSTSVAFSDSALNAFEQDERVIRGSERFDIVCANCGSSSASGAMIKMTL